MIMTCCACRRKFGAATTCCPWDVRRHNAAVPPPPRRPLQSRAGRCPTEREWAAAVRWRQQRFMEEEPTGLNCLSVVDLLNQKGCCWRAACFGLTTALLIGYVNYPANKMDSLLSCASLKMNGAAELQMTRNIILGWWWRRLTGSHSERSVLLRTFLF